MGIIILGAGLVAFVVAVFFGMGSLILHYKLHKNHGRGSWPIYAGVSLTVAVAAFWNGIRLAGFDDGSPGAPTNEDYGRAIIAFVWMGAAPGLGLLAGSLALLKRGTEVRGL